MRPSAVGVLNYNHCTTFTCSYVAKSNRNVTNLNALSSTITINYGLLYEPWNFYCYNGSILLTN